MCLNLTPAGPLGNTCSMFLNKTGVIYVEMEILAAAPRPF